MFRLLAFMFYLCTSSAFQPTMPKATFLRHAVIASPIPAGSPLFTQQPAAASRTGQKLQSLYSTAFDESSSSSEEALSADVPARFDGSAILKYCAAISVQMGLLAAIFTGLDKVVATYSLKIPFAANVVLFYFLALKSRVLNPMSNTRPQNSTLETAGKDTTAVVVKRNMPSWTPPGVIFPIVWLLIIGPIRAATSALVYKTVGTYASLPSLSLMLHLSIGDVWNTINNVERRYGVAVTGVFCVWLSKAHAAYQYGLVDIVAGKLLGATLIWLTIASTLVTATWRLNPDPATGKPEPLYPVTGKVRTKFAWFSGSNK